MGTTDGWSVEEWKRLAEKQRTEITRCRTELDILHQLEVAARAAVRKEPDALAEVTEVLWALDLWRERGLGG